MKWVGIMNACKAQAEEEMLQEIIYTSSHHYKEALQKMAALDSVQSFFKPAGGKLCQAVIPIEQLTFVEGAQLAHDSVLLHSIPPFAVFSVYRTCFCLSI